MQNSNNKVAQNGSLISAALILGIASLVSRLVGLVRERVFTTSFGAGDTFDAFVAAFRVPDLIFNLIVIGALSAAFIPLFTQKLISGNRQEGVDHAFAFAGSVLNIMVAAVGILSIIYAIFASQLMPLIAPGFMDEKLELTIRLSRIMAMQPILLAVSFVFSGVLNSFKRFVAYALAPILYNLGIIFGVVVLVPLMGIIGLGWGVVLGAALHALAQLPSMLAVGWRWRPVLVSSWQDLQKLWRMMLPRVFGLAAQQVNLLVVTILGSGLLAGSITAFHLANNIQYLPIGIFGIAFSQAAFPTLAEQIARGRSSEFRHTLTRTFRYILFFVIPISAFFFLLRAQIVRVLFGDGAFDWDDTILTYQTFGYLIISIFAQATIPLLTRAFYARHDTRTPLVISAVSMMLNLALAFSLAPRYGIQGLAMAFSVSAIVQLVLLLGTLHWQLHGFDDRQVIISLAKIVVATVVASAVLQLLKYPVHLLVNMQKFWGVFTQLLVTATAGIIVYLVLVWLFKSDELMALRKYLPRQFKPVAGQDTSRFSEIPE